MEPEGSSTTSTGVDCAQVLSAFAAAIGKSAVEVGDALRPLIGEPGPAALDALRSEDYTPFAELHAALPGVPTALLRRAVAEQLRSRAPAAGAGAATPTLSLDTSLAILPNAPDDSSLLAMLKAGGDLKVNQGTVISAIRAALANRSGLYDLPALLVDRMESHAESLEEPVGPEFFKLRKLLTQRNYGEIFAALDVEGAFVSQKRKATFLDRLDALLWPALSAFQAQLKHWTESWQQGMANPAALMAIMVGSAGGQALPPGMLQPPPTGALRDAAEAVNTQINRVFAGVGVPVAMALGYDAMKIREVLEAPNLPAQIGAASRDQMLKLLDVAVSADYVRLEQNLVRYALAIMAFPGVPADAELAYLTSMTMLGGQIPWDSLAAPSRRR
jgi:hypothetical protein